MADHHAQSVTNANTTSTTTTDNTDTKERKRKRNRTRPASAQQTTSPLPPPQHLYLVLDPIKTKPGTSAIQLDETTLRLHLLSALSYYLGDHGAAIPVDILAVPVAARDEDDDDDDEGVAQTLNPKEIVVRVPRPDGPAFMAALASWAGSSSGGVGGYVVRAKSEWLGEIIGARDVDELFDFAAGVDDG